MGISPTGKQIEYPIQLFCHFRDGKMTETWRSYDMLDIFHQLGVAPPMTQAVRQ
jgi:predicted ester cyclase